MKKVLILNPYFPTLGGGEKYMGYLCKFIEEHSKNVKIDILVHNYNNIDIHAEDYPDISQMMSRFNLKLSKTELRKINLIKASNNVEHLRNKNAIEKITQEYDIFINFMFLSKHIGKAKKNIYICMFPPTKFSFDGFWRKMVANYLNYRFVRSYDFFVPISLFTNHWMQHWWKNIKRTHLVYPPVFSEKEQLNRIPLDSKEIEKRKNIILSVGRFFVGAHNKKQDVLVDMFKKHFDSLKDWELHLVGGVSNAEADLEYISKISSEAKGYPIYIHNNCKYEELENLYRESKVFWHATGHGEDVNSFPDKLEHFGITTVEAMSYGVVPVVINKGGQAEIVNTNVEGFCWDTEEECIAYTLQISENEELRKTMSAKAMIRANYFSVENFYKSNKEIFDEI